MIGLVDYDFQSSLSTTKLIPNVEIMKLATYYKKEKNTFCRLIDLNETDLSIYDKIYFFSESEKPFTIPPQFNNLPNIIYGGTYFTKKYVPFFDSIIDYTLPRIEVYKEILKNKYDTGIKTKVISNALYNTYYRIYANNTQLPIPVILPKQNCYIFDKEFSWDAWAPAIEEITHRKVLKIIPIHTIRCKHLTDFLNMRAHPKISRGTSYLLDLNIPLKEVTYLLKHYGLYLKEDFVNKANIALSLGENFPFTYMYYNDFIYKMHLLFSFWSHDIPMRLKYVYPDPYIHNPLEKLSKKVIGWANGENKKKVTLQQFILEKNTQALPEAEDLIKQKPIAKALFHSTYPDLVRLKEWRI